LSANTGTFITENESSAELPNWLLEAINTDRKNMRINDTFRAFVFMALAFGLIYLFIKNKIKSSILLYGLALLTLVDLWQVNKRYLDNNSFEKKVVETYYTPTEADAVILQDTDPNYRVFNLNNPFNDARTSYFHKSIGGYSPAKLRRYQDFIERILSQEQKQLLEIIRSGSRDFSSLKAINMLNARYLILNDRAQGVIPNKWAYGNAWFVRNIKKVSSPDEEIKIFAELDTREEASLDESLFTVNQTEFELDSNATVTLKSYKPYDLTYEVNTKKPAFIVFSEVYYPIGWKAYIGDKELDIKRVNYILRGLEVPSGNYQIRFVMDNKTHKIGNLISLISSMILFGLIGFITFRAYKASKS
jgi:hypothetical protein